MLPHELSSPPGRLFLSGRVLTSTPSCLQCFKPTTSELLPDSRLDLIGASFAEGFVPFDVDAPPYPARNTLHAGKDTYQEISVRPS